MRLPQQTAPVLRQVAGIASAGKLDGSGMRPSANVWVTGMAVCRKNGSVLYSASERVCGAQHLACTDAKIRAVQSITADCQAKGGIPQQSSASCTYGAKC